MSKNTEPFHGLHNLKKAIKVAAQTKKPATIKHGAQYSPKFMTYEVRVRNHVGRIMKEEHRTWASLSALLQNQRWRETL